MFLHLFATKFRAADLYSLSSKLLLGFGTQKHYLHLRTGQRSKGRKVQFQQSGAGESPRCQERRQVVRAYSSSEKDNLLFEGSCHSRCKHHRQSGENRFSSFFRHFQLRLLDILQLLLKEFETFVQLLPRI